MKICFYANLRAITNQTTIDLNETGLDTLRHLIPRLVELYPDIRLHLLDPKGDLRSDLPIFVNGRNPRLDKAGLNIALQSDDIISIFSPIASGKMNVEVMRNATVDVSESIG